MSGQHGEIVPFDFDGREVRWVYDEHGKPWAVAVDVCAALDLPNVAQALKDHLESDERSSISITDGTPGSPVRAVVNESGIYGLIFGSRKPAARAFRRWITNEVLPAIRREGGYISPGATPEQLTNIAQRAAIQARVLQELKGIADPAWLEVKARHVAARALGEEPDVPPDQRPLTVGEYLEERGISGQALRSMSPTFGKLVKAAFRDRRGREPGWTWRFVSNRWTDVHAYTESDRDLFDEVWARFNQ